MLAWGDWRRGVTQPNGSRPRPQYPGASNQVLPAFMACISNESDVLLGLRLPVPDALLNGESGH
jgi:hypothetical protein